VRRMSILTINPHEFVEVDGLSDDQIEQVLIWLGEPDGVVVLPISPRRTRYLPSRNIVRLDISID
jgi:hypothetical protein